MNVTKTDLIIELHVSDFDKVKDFYGKLGFETVWERTPEEMKGYLVIKKGDTVLCFWPGNDQVSKNDYFSKFPENTKPGFGVELVIMVEDVNSYYEQIRSFANVVEPLKEQPWGSKDFRIEDPFGFYLRFSEPYDTLDKVNAVE